MSSTCPNCDSLLGPDEAAEGCVSCRGSRLDIADHLIAVLEVSRTPLPWWDVARMAHRTLGWTATEALVLNTLRTDDRACWAGRARYGMARHGLVPRVRDLGSAAGIHIHVADRSLSTAQVDYTLRRKGYRFSLGSLYPALDRAFRDGMVGRPYYGWSGSRASTFQRSAVISATGLRGAPLDEVLDTLADSVAFWLDEWNRRIAA